MTSVPALWLDWCAVTGTDTDGHDESALQRFARQTGASRAVLNQLRPPAHPDGPAWPDEHRDDAGSLVRLIERGTRLIDHPDTDWITRLRLRRLLFAAAVLAPTSHGGAGLDRRQASGLTPDRLSALREHVVTTQNEDQCPRCALWSWLEVVGENTGWSHAAVRALGHRRDLPRSDVHRHTRTDPSPDWRTASALQMGIDRWGHLDPWMALHPSTVSVLLRGVRALLEDPPPPVPPAEPVPRPPVRVINAEEEAAIHARADAVLARVRDLLAELD